MATAAEVALDAVKILLGAGAGALIAKRVQGKPKLVAYWGHVSSFTMKAQGTQEPLTITRTRSWSAMRAAKPLTTSGFRMRTYPISSTYFPQFHTPLRTYRVALGT